MEEDPNPWAHCMVVWGNLLYEHSQFRCSCFSCTWASLLQASNACCMPLVHAWVYRPRASMHGYRLFILPDDLSRSVQIAVQAAH